MAKIAPVSVSEAIRKTGFEAHYDFDVYSYTAVGEETREVVAAVPGYHIVVLAIRCEPDSAGSSQPHVYLKSGTENIFAFQTSGASGNMTPEWLEAGIWPLCITDAGDALKMQYGNDLDVDTALNFAIVYAYAKED